MAIARLGVRNFRCLDKVEIDLPPFAVLIGANGAGKSSLLHSLRMLRSLADGTLQKGFSRLGGFNATLCRRTKEDSIILHAVVPAGDVDLDYHIFLLSEGREYQVHHEYLRCLKADPIQQEECRKSFVLSPNAVPPQLAQDVNTILVAHGRGGHWREDGGTIGDIESTFIASNRSEAIVHDLEQMNKRIAELLESFRLISSWNLADFDLSAVRSPQAFEPADSPSPNGDNLIALLHDLRSNRHDTYMELLEFLQVACPELERIEFPSVGKGFVSLNWFEKNLDKPFDARDLSDGTIRLLWLATILITAREGSVILLDEPEISLHPQWLMLLVSLMRQTAVRAQVIVATQSDQLLRWVEPEELIVVDMEDGLSRFQKGNDMDLAEWLKDYTLDRLWLMGELGGRR